MSLFLPFQRATLLIPSGPDQDRDRKHLFIVLTDPHPIVEGGANAVLLVSISTLHPDRPHDPTCILYPGDHPFIRTESFVSYRLARIVEVESLTRGVSDKKLFQHATLDGGIFARVCHGLTQSRHTAPAMLSFYEAATL
jgi:hypothetical protein